MKVPPRVLVRRTSETSYWPWGLYLPEEDRWLDLLFSTKLEARKFANEIKAQPTSGSGATGA